MSHRSVRRAHQRRLEASARREARLRRLGLSAGAVVASTAFAASSAQAATFQVTSTADAAADACDVAGTGNGCTLRDAVRAANDAPGADVITFASDVTGVIRLTEVDPGSDVRQLPVGPGGLTISGPGSTVLAISGDSDDDDARGEGDSRHFEVDGDASLALSGLTLTEGVAPESAFPKYFGGGGSIVVRTGGTLDLRDAAITASTSDNVGGALLLGGATTIARTTFSGNSAGGGGAIAQTGPGSGDGAQAGTLTIEDSAFTGNAASRGGAISTSKYGNAASAPLTVTGTTFAGNTAASSGGAIAAAGVDTDGPITVRESLFTGNSAGGLDSDGEGGAIALNGVQDADLPETDDLGTVTLDRNTFSGNTTGGEGGALLLDRAPDGETAVTRSTLVGNQAASGGAVAIGRDARKRRQTRAAAPTTTGVTLDGLTISGNAATSLGGGVFTASRSVFDAETQTTRVVPSTQVVTSSIVAGNTADGVAGDLAQSPVTTDEDENGGYVLRHSLVQAPAGAQFATDSDRPSLIGVDPLLQALALTAGRTPTMLPGADSPVVDAGRAADGVNVDQRGLERTVDQPEVANATGGDGTDIGAVERAAPPAPETPPAPQPAAPAVPVAPASVPAQQLPPPGTSTLGLPPAPISRPSVVRNPRQPITIRGTAGRGTTKVRISLARKIGSQCKFLLSTKKFSARRDCRRTLYVTAQGTTSWRLTLPVLSKGKYTIWSRAISGGRLVEKKKTTQNFRRFEIR